MNCVTSSSLQILWNEGFTDAFVPSGGVRQGDPISPYLFVLTMERLDNAIRRVVSEASWKPIMVGRGRPLLSHLFFANDLVLFGEARIKNEMFMKKLLEDFCNHSCHKVSSLKSKIYFLSNTTTHVREQIRNVMRYKQTEDLMSYLRVPLFHFRVKKSTFQFLVDKIQQRLSGLDANLLSLAMRVTLAKSVLLTTSKYFMQAAMIPIGVCEKIEQVIRRFV